MRLPPEAARTARSAKNAAAPLHQSRESHHSARPLHAPEGAMRSRALSTRHQELAPLKQPVGAKGLPQSKHGRSLNALTCGFAPLAGLEPAPHGLEVRQHPSA